jgi:copper homeostasis protein (lipoprotein)
MALFVAACAAVVPADPPSEPAKPGGFYIGVLPCADCGGMRHRLLLRPDGVFILETEYLGKEAGPANPYTVLGAWSVTADGQVLELRQSGVAPLWFSVQSPDVLRKLDIEGRPIESRLNYGLTRTPAGEPFQPLLRIEGMYSYMADAGIFRECVSQVRFPVAQAADNAALEHGYGAARGEPGEAILVTLDARIAARPGMEGDRLVDAVVVERFIGAWPGETCGNPLVTANLIDTYWKLTRIGDQPVPLRPEGREPHMILQSDGNRVGGFGGCNRFMGGFRQAERSLEFGQIASTMMACMDGMDLEQEFLGTLGATSTWKITGEHLELYDSGGTVIARFEARARK